MTPAALRVLVVDDEAPARSNIVALLAGDPQYRVVGEARNGAEAVDLIRELDPDVVLLDIQMPGLDGFAVIETVGTEAMPAVIFVTAYDDFAVRAFEASATDYLVKPFSEARLHESLARAARRIGEATASRALRALLDHTGTSPVPADALTRLAIRDGDATRFVKVDDIDWIEAADYYVEIHAGGATHLLRLSLSALEARLDPRRFVRIHRSTIVNLDRVRELTPWTSGGHAVLLHDGTKLILSRRRRGQLEAALGQSI